MSFYYNRRLSIANRQVKQDIVDRLDQEPPSWFAAFLREVSAFRFDGYGLLVNTVENIRTFADSVSKLRTQFAQIFFYDRAMTIFSLIIALFFYNSRRNSCLPVMTACRLGFAISSIR